MCLFRACSWGDAIDVRDPAGAEAPDLAVAQMLISGKHRLVSNAVTIPGLVNCHILRTGKIHQF